MEKFYIVKISHYVYWIVSELKKVEVRLFSSEDEAEDFLVQNGFIFGCPAGFKCANWYHSSCLGCSHIFDFTVATIDPVKLDDNSPLDSE